MSAPPRPNLRLTLPEIMTSGEVAHLFRMHYKTISKYDAVLKPYRTLGGHRRYRRDLVVDLYEARVQERAR